MTDMNQNAMITAETEEDYPVEIVDRQMCDERDEQRKDKIVDSLHKAADTMKMQTAIAKKEADTSAYATKTYVSDEHAYIEMLRKDAEREDLTPEERVDRFDRIEEAQKRLKETEKESRIQAEGSPFRKRVSIWDYVLGTVAIGGAVVFGWKVMPKLVA